MTQRSVLLGAALVLAIAAASVKESHGVPPAEPGAAAETAESLPETETEARTRARVLHETIHGSLQVMHRDFFDPRQRLSIPSRSLEDVFKELAKTWRVDVHWLAVSADAMNVDNKPRDDFEREAARQLGAGKAYYDTVDGSIYRFAGAIRLSSQCLKCHAPRRTTTDDRTAGLVISMPLRKTSE